MELKEIEVQSQEFSSELPRIEVTAVSGQAQTVVSPVAIGIFRGHLCVSGSHTKPSTTPLLKDIEARKAIWSPLSKSTRQDNDFVGRVELLMQLNSILNVSDPAEIIVICNGIGGVGKTQLVLKYMLEAEGKYILRIWFPAENIDNLKQYYIQIASELGYIEQRTSFENALRYVNQFLAKHSRWLLVYDDVINYSTIKQFLPEKGGKIIITSCYQEWSGKIQKVPIDIMSEDEAVLLVKKITKSIEDTSIKELFGCGMLSFLPLALAQASAYISHCKINVQEYINRYKINKKKMLEDARLPEGTEHKSVAVTWQISIEAIQKEAVKENIPELAPIVLLLACAYLAPNNIPRNILSSWFKLFYKDLDNDICDYLLGKLNAYSLIKLDEKFIFLHRLVQDIVRIYYGKNDDVEWHMNLIKACNQYLSNEEADNFSEEEDKKRHLLPHLICLIDLFDKNFPEKKFLENDDKGKLSEALIYITIGYELSGKDMNDAVKYAQRAYNIKKELYDAKDPFQIVHALTRLGLCDKNNSEDHFKKASEIKDANQPSNYIEDYWVASPHICLANVLREKGKLEEARKLYEKSIKQTRSKIDENNAAFTLKFSFTVLNYGILCEKLNDLDKAQNCMKEAYTIREKLRSGHHGVIAASKPLANLYSKIGKYDDAIKLLQETCTISNSYYGGNHEKTIELERLLRQAEKEK